VSGALIGRVLTAASVRGTSLGRELLRRAIAASHRDFAGRSIRRAPHRLERFYEDPGSVGVGEPYLEDGLPHIEMLRVAP
jgi:ElaA protein